MTTLLVIDIGNTNVSIGLFDYDGDRGALAHHWRTGTHREQTSDEVGLTLRSLFEHEGRSSDSVSDVGLMPSPGVIVFTLMGWCDRSRAMLRDRPSIPNLEAQ